MHIYSICAKHKLGKGKTVGEVGRRIRRRAGTEALSTACLYSIAPISR
jgi:hypothetical protein